MDAYNSKMASRIVGVSLRQIQYWDEQGFIRPSVKLAGGRGTKRLYSFHDLVCLKVVKDLARHGLSLNKIRRCVRPVREYAAEALQHAEVEAVAPYVEGEALLIADREGGASSAASVRGVEPGLEAQVSAIRGRLTSGSLDALQAGEFNILLGSELASRLGVGVGDSVVMAIAQGTVTPAGVVPRMRRFTVSGVFFSGMYEIVNGLALTHLQDAGRLFRLGPNVSSLRLMVLDPYRAPLVTGEGAGTLGGGLYVDDWTQRHANFFRSIELTKRMMFFILLLVVAVATSQTSHPKGPPIFYFSTAGKSVILLII